MSQREYQFDYAVAAHLALMSAITYNQYLENQANLAEISFKNASPEFSRRSKETLQGYIQVAVFLAPDTNWLWLTSQTFRTSKNFMQWLLWLNMWVLGCISWLTPLLKKEELFGFALEPSDESTPIQANIIALRGTSDTEEWLVDSSAFLIPYKASDVLKIRVHAGFLSLYQNLHQQIIKAVQAFKNPELPLYITGHSLGAALATLAAYQIAQDCPELAGRISMYNFASPKVGDTSFVKTYNQLIPASFRIVNLADIVPMMPSNDVEIGAVYDSVGQEYAYLHQTNSLTSNHAIADNYLKAVTENIPTNSSRIYPIRALE